MNIKEIKQIVSLGISDSDTERLILLSMASDKNVIPDILGILEYERSSNNELILDMNSELSRALLMLDNENIRSNCQPSWVAGEIKKFYLKWKGSIKCNFKVDGLE